MKMCILIILGGTMAKNLPANARDASSIPGLEDPWRRKWQHTPVFLPGKFRGERILADYNSWGHKMQDMTEHTHIQEQRAISS